MKKLFSTLLVVFFATSMMAQTGLTCEDPIPVDKSYAAHVEVDPDEGYLELWYSAWTYDLPMHVYFSPDVDDSDWGPEVQIDFSCTGDYTFDHKLDSIINILTAMGLSLPVEFMCDKVTGNNKVEWDLSIEERYRDQLTEFGLTHNVQALVKVTYYESGSIRLTPDTAFQSCIDNGHYAQLGDTIDIAANDSEKMIVLPFSEWQKDSIRFVWTGDQPARIWVAEDECRFTPVDASMFVKAKYDVDNTTPKKLYPSDMENAIANWIGAGIFYAKVLSEGAGQLIIERIPLGEIQGDAILLKHGEPVQLSANDNRVFCFPKTWKSTEFLANTQYLMAMHVSNTPEFEVGDANVITKYDFHKEDNKRQLQLSKGDISTLSTFASDDYFYVRFVCNTATVLTPSLWNPSACGNSSILLSSGDKRSIVANSSKTVYRLRFDDWKGYDFTIKWSGYSTLPTYISDQCDYMLSSSDPAVLIYKNVKARNSTTITKNDMEGWEEHVDVDGFLYVRFNPTNKGDMTITSAKPAETDPEGPVLEPVYSEVSAAVCYGETYEWNGYTCTEDGKYTYTTVAANGADSIVTLTLTIYPETPATTEEVTVEFGETYEWNDKVYAESGEYTITLQDEHDCPYQATLLLTVLPQPEAPCVAKSVLLEPTAQITMNLEGALTIYRIDYDAWVANGVNLVWSGSEALHTFVALDCDFAVAVHHKDVVRYEEVPAQGNVVLSKEILSGLSQYVDADGYLYVRFLTEFEGVLTTTKPE